MKAIIIEQSDIFCAGLIAMLIRSGKFTSDQIVYTSDITKGKELCNNSSGNFLLILGQVSLTDQNYNSLVESVSFTKRGFMTLLIPDFIQGKDCKQLFKQRNIDGVLLRGCSERDFNDALETILSGEVYLSTSINLHDTPDESVRNIKKDHPLYLIQRLTLREREILDLVIEGKSSTEISSEIFIATHTVKTHRKNILRKLGVNNTLELIAYIESIQVRE